MAQTFDDQIRRSRKLLQNPYAHLDGDGDYDAIPYDNNVGVHDARRILENPYAYLDEHGGYRHWQHKDHKPDPMRIRIPIDQLLGAQERNKRWSKPEIAKIARNLQLQLWNRRRELFPDRTNIIPLEVLDPTVALESIGYSVHIRESLGQHSSEGELFEVAGIFDNAHAQVQISRRFSPEIRNFTTAHELAHAILHHQCRLHRDRALDGSPLTHPRDARELEADIFAAYFLLPTKVVINAFQMRFLTRQFALREEAVFALTGDSSDALQARCRTLRDLTRILARASRYNGVQFCSLAQAFGVSIEAMAIRLEELNLAQL